MYDGQEAVDYRLRFPRHRNKLDPEVVAVLQEMLVQVNALVEASQGTVSAISANTMRLKLLERMYGDDQNYIYRFYSTAVYQKILKYINLKAKILQLNTKRKNNIAIEQDYLTKLS
ncbi:hypothetical protein POM88_033482 [Heracleum sosnowskyi]|uniref:Uncharacterized protein n=1 Tax=Heracleum sosnowskyi TaxID=360622 RepID=A0AAD8I186_9APIA|nr:hypothetical protein POM88_033482 [Heracleum sosnowskyi]